MAYLHDLADTWNDSGTTFTALKMNVTDTASNSASKLLDLQVGGSSKLNVRKNGRIYGDGSNPYVELSQSLGSTLGYGASSLFIGSTARITTNYSLSLVIDSYTTVLSCDAANTLALRNSTNAQRFNIYETYTDASNYARGYVAGTTSGLDIGTEAAGTGTKRPVRILGQSLASAEAVSLLELSQTWNTTGTPTAIKLNITDTASNAASKLLDLQVGGSSKASFDKGGRLRITQSYSLPNHHVGDATGGISFSSGGTYFNSTTSSVASVTTAGIASRSTGYIGWAPGAADASNADVSLYRDAANTLGLRNSTNAQAFNVYNTYTDASNYERGFARFSSNTFNLGTERAGTGSARDIYMMRNGTIVTHWKAGAIDIASQILQLITNSSLHIGESSAAPAASANAVRIYAEDDGSGKTRLMALFGTGAAQQIAIEP